MGLERSESVNGGNGTQSLQSEACPSRTLVAHILKLSYPISTWHKRERNGTYETLSYKIICFWQLRCHSESIKIPLMQSSQRPTCPALFTLESRRKLGHDLRGCVQCRVTTQAKWGPLHCPGPALASQRCQEEASGESFGQRLSARPSSSIMAQVREGSCRVRTHIPSPHNQTCQPAVSHTRAMLM